MGNQIRLVGISVAVILVLLATAYMTVNDPLPEGIEGPEAENLADEMLKALEARAYDNIDTLSWTYRGEQQHIWYKKENLVEVRWKKYTVLLNLNDLTGTGFIEGEEVIGESLEKLLQEAWAHFANDSFWLVAPYKIRDPGTSRRFVDMEDGPGLLVTYSSGGVTPGDSYLWVLGENFRPLYWKMWTQRIPIGGLKFHWESWRQLKGAWFAPNHRGSAGIEVKITRLEAY